MFILELKNSGQAQLVGKLYVIGDIECALKMAVESIKKIRCDEVHVFRKKTNALVAVMKKAAMEQDLAAMDEDLEVTRERSMG